ncbi:MAG: hypothetical protein ACI8TX_000041 [Hyphomicrobiaceae bacterium]
MSTQGRKKRGPRLIAGRPRFVIALVVAATVIAPLELWHALGGLPSATAHFVLGARAGETSVAWSALFAVFYAVVGLGLWRKRDWARRVGMVWFAALLASVVLLWSPDGYGAGAAGGAVLWQISAVPCLTFAMMYLYLGERWFD